MSEFFDNWFEILYWFSYGLLSCFLWGWWGIGLALVCSILGRLGGMKGHSIRVFCCPLTIVGPRIFSADFIVWLFLALSSAVISMGYSVPDVNQKKSSWLGEFFYDTFEGKQPYVDIATRGTIFIILTVFIGILFIHA